MKNSKKVVSLVFVVLLLISIVPISASAAEVAYGDFSFKTDSVNKVATLVDYNGNSSTVKVPDTIYGYTVNKIDDLVFFKHREIKSISLPNTITSIGFSAFSDCSKLEKVILPVTVTSIGEYAFQNCTSLKEAYVNSAITEIPTAMFKNCTSLSTVKINFYTEKISSRAFENCTSLKNLPDASRIKEIGQEAFYNAGLESITINNSVTTISKGAFSCCEKLSYVNMPDSVTSIDDNAFLDCSKELVIRGNYGSYAEKYATENNIAFEEIPPLIGDVNNDGLVDVKDATYIQRYVNYEEKYDIPYGTLTFRRADANYDGLININDATLIQKYAMHMIDEF